MLLKRMFLLVVVFMFMSLIGCKKTYVLANDVSSEYLRNNEFTSPNVLPNKISNVLFIIPVGYVEAEASHYKLVVFLMADSLREDELRIRSVDLIGDDGIINYLVVDQRLSVESTAETERLGLKVKRARARFEFDPVSLKKLLKMADLKLRVYFQKDGLDNHIDLKVRLVEERVWPA